MKEYFDFKGPKMSNKILIKAKSSFSYMFAVLLKIWNECVTTDYEIIKRW